MKKPFYIVDVFTDSKFNGNPLAVVAHDNDLVQQQMQQIAKEMNYSETIFIHSQDPTCKGWDVRIFTPKHEIPFAGHPLLGAAYVIQDTFMTKKLNEIYMNLQIGPIPIDYGDKDIIWLQTIKPFLGSKIPSNILAKVLGIHQEDIDHRYPNQEVSTGIHVIIVPLKNLSAVEQVKINLDHYYALIKQTKSKAILVFAPEALFDENDLHVRVFADYYGVPEDPATGSANACLAAYLMKYHCLAEQKDIMRVEQGYEMNRPSLLYLKVALGNDEMTIKVGGQVQMVAKGELFI